MASNTAPLTFRDIIPIKLVYIYFTGLAILTYLFPESRLDLLQAAEFTIFTLAWIYTYVVTAASGRMILLSAFVVVGCACNGIYLYYFWRVFQTRGFFQRTGSPMATRRNRVDTDARMPPVSIPFFIPI